jgi:hypothetical protein
VVTAFDRLGVVLFGCLSFQVRIRDRIGGKAFLEAGFATRPVDDGDRAKVLCGEIAFLGLRIFVDVAIADSDAGGCDGRPLTRRGARRRSEATRSAAGRNGLGVVMPS